MTSERCAETKYYISYIIWVNTLPDRHMRILILELGIMNHFADLHSIQEYFDILRLPLFPFSPTATSDDWYRSLTLWGRRICEPVISQINLARLQARLLWPDTQLLNQPASYEELLTAMTVVWQDVTTSKGSNRSFESKDCSSSRGLCSCYCISCIRTAEYISLKTSLEAVLDGGDVFALLLTSFTKSVIYRLALLVALPRLIDIPWLADGPSNHLPSISWKGLPRS